MKSGVQSTWRAVAMLIFSALAFSAIVAALLVSGAYLVLVIVRAHVGGKGGE